MTSRPGAEALTDRAPSAEPLVRFDSLDPARGPRSLRFSGHRATLAADGLAEVLPVLQRVEEAVSRGLHAAGFLAYEAAPAFDPALAVHPADPRLPLAWFALFEAREEVPALQGVPDEPFSLGEWTPSLGAEAYARRVAAIRELIAAGDTYQVNFTLRLDAAFAGSDLGLYGALCRAQRSAYGALLRLGGLSVVSASPELFFRWSEGELELRPMKGTRPRGRWEDEDAALAAELVASPKERAENLMIVDLLRNDAGRVSEWGSVHVPRLFETERYETVHQLTSTVRSRTVPGTGLADVLRALFPSGSVTGAPKVRTMQIIRELEDGPRGVYTGAIGFVSPGETVFSVGIRTLLVDRARGRAELGVGSGITYDAGAEAEYRECLDKARFATHPPADFELLETLLWEPPGGWFLLGGHLDRMAASARYFGFRFHEERVRAALSDTVSGSPDGPLRVRLLLARDGEVRAETSPLAPTPTAPARVALSTRPVDSRDPFLCHKTTRREVYTTRAAERPDCDDVILVNERGEVTESTIANVVARIGGALWTPPREAGLLPGVFRRHLLETGEVRERPLRPEDLRDAEELYLVNSVRRWRRAELVP
ncbi:MAG TPA: aminodeoxychorismate synthase component I [Longimicrobiaceae bacterium]|nr:aminodeoxychorismate synthase component I [Longimicrobiaceae bacterium]